MQSDVAVMWPETYFSSHIKINTKRCEIWYYAARVQNGFTKGLVPNLRETIDPLNPKDNIKNTHTQM